MGDWKEKAIASWETHREGCAAQDAEHKADRIERAKEKLISALQKLNIPLPANAEIRVIDDPEFGALPFVTIDDIEFSFGPYESRQPGHGGGLGIHGLPALPGAIFRSIHLRQEHSWAGVA